MSLVYIGTNGCELVTLAPYPKASTVLPVADNEVDTAIRTGIVGTSADFARADHNHPIRRQVAPADPVLTYSGAGTMPQSIVTGRWTDEESVTYAYRSRVDATATTGWNIVTHPNLVGFQRPQITVEGTYRSTGNPQATMPRAPYMGNEANHWSSTQRVYIGPYNQKTGTGRYYLATTVKYTRL